MIRSGAASESTTFTKILRLAPPPSQLNAICVPSGENEGEYSLPGRVVSGTRLNVIGACERQSRMSNAATAVKVNVAAMAISIRRREVLLGPARSGCRNGPERAPRKTPLVPECEATSS